MKGIHCKTEVPFDRILLSRGTPEWEWQDVSRRSKSVPRASSLPYSRALCPEAGMCGHQGEVCRQARCEEARKTSGETSLAIVEPDADMLVGKSIGDDQINVVVSIDIMSSDSQTQCIVVKKEERSGRRVTAQPKLNLIKVTIFGAAQSPALRNIGLVVAIEIGQHPPGLGRTKSSGRSKTSGDRKEQGQ